jgi:hypothetical protein
LTYEGREAFFGEQIPVSGRGSEVRFDIVVLDHQARTAHVVEVKDGDTFDTKKANGELASIQAVAAAIAESTGYAVSFSFCCFNQEDKDLICAGAKGRFSKDQAMTGRELCRLLEIDYDALVELRQRDVADNLSYFLDELVAIPRVAELLREKLHGGRPD